MHVHARLNHCEFSAKLMRSCIARAVTTNSGSWSDLLTDRHIHQPKRTADLVQHLLLKYSSTAMRMHHMRISRLDARPRLRPAAATWAFPVPIARSYRRAPAYCPMRTAGAPWPWALLSHSPHAAYNLFRRCQCAAGSIDELTLLAHIHSTLECSMSITAMYLHLLDAPHTICWQPLPPPWWFG